MSQSWTNEFHAASTAHHVRIEVTSAIESGRESQWTDVQSACPSVHRDHTVFARAENSGFPKMVEDQNSGAVAPWKRGVPGGVLSVGCVLFF